MDNHSMKEADAFSFIQRTAMRLRLTMKEVARQVIDGSLTP
jgi:AmiR/NasT family two-component response regulator